MESSYMDPYLIDSPSRPVRKLFACELRMLTFNELKGCYEIKIDGKIFDVHFVWLQGYLYRRAKNDWESTELPAILGDSSINSDWMFKDRSASGIPVMISSTARELYGGYPEKASYYSVMATVNHSQSVSGSIKREFGIHHDDDQDENVQPMTFKIKKFCNLTKGLFDDVRHTHNRMLDDFWCCEVVQYHDTLRS